MSKHYNPTNAKINLTKSSKRHNGYSFWQIFSITVPVMLGFIPLGIAFGVLAKSMGVSLFIAISLSMITYAGAGQFAFLSMLGAGASYFEVAMASYFINLRHSFYAMALLKDYAELGFRWFNIFALTDESFAIFKTLKIADISERTYVFSMINLLTYLYWAIGTLLGYGAGALIRIDYSGIEFCLVALFIVLAIEMYKAEQNPIVLGFSVLCGVLVLAFVPSNLMLLVGISACFGFVLITRGRL